jgi:hypothetical protein
LVFGPGDSVVKTAVKERNIMKIATLAIAAVMSAASIGTTAFAQAPAASSPIVADDMVTVVLVSEANKSSDATTQVPDMYRKPSSDTVSKAQSMLKKDAALMKNLEGKKVQTENVVGIETAANGGKVVYVK